MWSFTLHNTITGQRLQEVRPSSGRWGRSPGAGDGEHTVQLLDAEFPVSRAHAQQLAQPNAVTLVVAWLGAPMYAGVVITAPYSRSTGTVTLRHVDIRALFKERLTFGVSTYPNGDLSITGRSISGLVEGVLQRGVYSWGESWRLPIDLPTNTGGGESISVKRWDWKTIEELLLGIEKLGATVDFDPYYATDGGLRFRTRVGTPTLPGSSFEWVVTAEETPVTNLVVTADGSKQITGCFYVGNGSEVDLRFGEAGFVGGPSIPVRDATRPAKDEQDVSKLNRMAMTDLLANRSPKVEWSFDLVADGTWDVSSLKPGSRVNLHSHGDPFLADGRTDLVVTGVSGDMSYVLKPEVRPL